jgi:hypothetical protein
MKAIHIVDNDREFRNWIAQNPDGYVLNANRKPRERYLVLHTARCPEWQTESTLTEGSYSKIVASSEEDIRDWMALVGFSRNAKIVNGKGCRCLRFENPPIRHMSMSSNDAGSDELMTSFADFCSLEGSDTRELALCTIRLRRGQSAFRESLRRMHGDACMITGCVVVDVIEAAHIKPYRGDSDNHVQNGLLLRADIHTLFDLGLIGIDPVTLRIKIDDSLAASEYAQLDGSALRIRREFRLSREALEQRWLEFNR